MFRLPEDYFAQAGGRMMALARDLYPICRSITGNGVRETLDIVKQRIPLEIVEVPTGTPVLDWEVPNEWNIRDAHISNSKGERVVDFNKSNLHVVGYSAPIDAEMTLDELSPHLHTLPDHPDWIPYRTGYFSDTWGFCLSENVRQSLSSGERYRAVIDATLEPGHLTYGELVIGGQTDQEVLLSAHTCHPSLANDNLSGIGLLVEIAELLARHQEKLRYTYRLLFAPGTIGAITWLAQNEDKLDRMASGLVVSCVGDGGGPLYKRSRRGDGLIDQAMGHVLAHSGIESASVKDFWPYGYDERQYCSPGFNLPVGLFQRSQYGEFPQYHTSADDLDFIAAEHLAVSLDLVLQALGIVETSCAFLNTSPKGEPQLGRRGLYNAIGGQNDSAELQLAILWVLNLSDGEHSLLDIAERAGIPYERVQRVATLLEDAELLERPG
jgi:aminopeptidase-like protein